MRRLVALLIITACKSSGDHATDATHDGVAGCGDGVKMGTEQCDGTDLGSATCSTALAPGWIGVVSCTASCEINVAACSTPATTYNGVTDASKWASFALTSLFAGANGFIGSAFDGRYMYFSPDNNGAPDGIVARYDTQGGFGSSGSWITFDVATVNSAAKGFQGAAFDGRYIYLVPYDNATSGTIARYDTLAPGGFGASTSWATFDVSTIDAMAIGYVRAVFDGRYLYLVPYSTPTVHHGVVARFDTQGTNLDDPTAWTTFDASTANVGSKGFLAGGFDGRYVYLVPYYNGVYDGIVTRYDTQSPTGFASAASWSIFDLQTINPNLDGFRSASFDGQYMYFVQTYNGGAMVPAYGGLVARFDTQQSFTSAGAWQVFDVATVNAGAVGFIGSAFDGRYVLLVPYSNNTATDGLVARFDTKAPFTTTGSWDVFDVTAINANAKGFQGAGFDGQYFYLVPSTNGVITRFDTKSPSWMPRGWNAAFD